MLDIDSEKNDQDRLKDANWPSQGKIEIENIKLRYRPTTDVVLKGLNASFKPGEKIGVVGRTGAGKSTLAMALTRMVDVFEGSIKIDGVDISKVNLQQVRESITIIPQEPTLFKGSIRFNVDPTGQCTDEEIRKVLVEAELDQLIMKKKDEDEKSKKEREEKERAEREERERAEREERERRERARERERERERARERERGVSVRL